MKEFWISSENEGQRLLRLVEKILPAAPRGFLYKALRKKTIDCNGKKAAGEKILSAGDVVRFWLSEETFAKFSAVSEKKTMPVSDNSVSIVYEDADFLLVKKPRGMPTQNDSSGTAALNDWLAQHKKTAVGVRPSACHRLDRNTEGLVLCGKTVRALQAASAWIAERKIRKWYRALVFGQTEEAGSITKWLLKNRDANLVTVCDENTPGAVPARTDFQRLSVRRVGGEVVSEIEAELLTGRSHQIRVHMAFVGHPLLGDPKYGTKKIRDLSRRLGFSAQALSATKIRFPKTNGLWAYLSEKEFSIVPDFESRDDFQNP